MMPGRPITEEDLQGYVDSVLDAARCEDVEAYLKQHPDVALRVRGYERQRDGLRAMLSPIAEEPIPPELSLARLAEIRRHPARLAPWRAVAAAILLFGLGSASGWTIHSMSGSQPTGIAALAQEAAYNYAVYGPDDIHPVEFNATDESQLVNWISHRLNAPITVPDLSASGYHFMGGRLVATEYGPAGLLMYGNGHGLRLVLLVRQMKRDMNTPSMSQSNNDGTTAFTWARDGVGYSVAGAASADVLHPIANEMRRQINESI